LPRGLRGDRLQAVQSAEDDFHLDAGDADADADDAGHHLDQIGPAR
jgi:hypothetical protein